MGGRDLSGDASFPFFQEHAVFDAQSYSEAGVQQWTRLGAAVSTFLCFIAGLPAKVTIRLEQASV